MKIDGLKQSIDSIQKTKELAILLFEESKWCDDPLEIKPFYINFFVKI